MPELKVEVLPTESLVPYANNAKVHTSWQIDQIVDSIERFGNCDPIAVWHNDKGEPEIVEGHGRLLALQRLGIKEAPVITLDHLTDEQRRAYTHVHNKLNMNTGFDLSILAEDLNSIEFDWEDFGFDIPEPEIDTEDERGDWFEVRERNDTSRQEGNKEYNEFLDKFEAKKTTDDCYTPDLVYDAVLGWVRKEYGISENAPIVRPFYPNGDYEHEDYPDGCVVVDNPPFSIVTEITRFYVAKGIRFFIFAPSLTLFTSHMDGVCYVASDCDITYENGAEVNTSFITNLDEECMVRTAPDLHEAVKEANKENRQELDRAVNIKYRYPPNVITAAMVSNWAALGVDYRLPFGEGVFVRALDSQKEVGKAIFGSGILLSEKATDATEKAKADANEERDNYAAKQLRMQAEKSKEAAQELGENVEIDRTTGEVVWKLSGRELEIVRGLGGK